MRNLKKVKSDIPAFGPCQCGQIETGRTQDGRWICAACYRPLWLTMDSAPKDGKTVFGYEHGWIGTIRYCSGPARWRDEIDALTDPSYWMPLPEGPKL